MDFQLKSGLYKKLAIYSMLIAFVLGIALSLFQIYSDYRQQDQQFNQSINNIIDLVKPSAEKAVYEFDENLGALVIDNLFDQEAILKATIIDDYGDIFQARERPTSRDNEVWYSNFTKFQPRELSFPLTIPSGADNSKAAVEIYVDPYTSLGHFVERSWLTLITGLIRSVLIALVLLYFSYKFVTRPIQSIAKNLSTIDPFADKPQQLTVKSEHKNNELGLLVGKINELFHNLQNGIQRIQNLNNKLNSEINERQQIEELINYAETNTRGITGYDYINTMLCFLTDSLSLRGAIIAKKTDRNIFMTTAHYFSDVRMMDPDKLYQSTIELPDDFSKQEYLLFNQEERTAYFDCHPTLLLPVNDHDGHIIGLIGLIKMNPFAVNFYIQHKALLQIFSSRISTEFIRDSQIKVIENLAHNDSLTQLANRHHFNQRLKNEIRLVSKNHKNLSLLYLDLYRFKWVNDSFGHKVGDQLLIEIAQRLKAQVTASDLVARIGGDEFAILLIDKTIEDAKQIAQSIHRAIAAPISIDDIVVNTKVSIGITTYSESSKQASKLLKDADMAMFLAKSLPDPKTQVYSTDVNQQVMRRISLESAMRHAIEDEDFYLVYQPQYQLATGTMVGVEALIRWQHAELGLISPEEFIPIAEETGMIHKLSEIVIKKSAEQARDWIQESQYQFKLSVNVSAYQLKNSSVFNDLLKSLEAIKDIANFLTIEITETALIENIDVTASLLQKITDLGVSLSIDDFGTGYSSLGYLKSLPLHYLKIDKAFISAIPESANDIHIVQAVIALSKAMKLEVVAEGVETKAQMNLLRDYGCDFVQGYFYSKPVSAEAISQKIQQQKQSAANRSAV
ncbi:MAG: bifunctional diguanylate cyclase/phosphodiesterase [Gammaproteobacteria bacterium]|nr:bifunctional diguanylate cyclase/phosphodiesterase [Gammaproteobacteria bacterium]